MARKLHIKKGDNVMVIAGDSKGQQGRVLVLDPEKERAIVEGINMVAKHTRPNKDNPKGGIIRKEAPIHLSNLLLVDSKGNATRIRRSKDEKSEKNVRISIKSGEVIK
ncbi:MAG: 50S ribosomal protein L24 [Bacteroidetes bacterium]|nr:50S ribosomal protein L24 [Bacteroidota bacterium]